MASIMLEAKAKQIMDDPNLSWKQKEERIEELRLEQIDEVNDVPTLRENVRYLGNLLQTHPARPDIGQGCAKT